MKNTYIVVSVNENDKNNAFTIKVSDSENLLGRLQMKGVEIAQICETKKKAEEIADFWNECYKKNGTYRFE